MHHGTREKGELELRNGIQLRGLIVSKRFGLKDFRDLATLYLLFED